MRGPVHLDEVVAASQCAQTSLQAGCILQIPEAFKACQVESLPAALPYVHSGGNEVGGFVNAGKVKVFPAQVDCVHAAADIYPYNVGYGLVLYGHCRSDGASRTGVDVGHDADPGPFRKRAVAHASDLIDSFLLYDLCKA